jgi:anti-anti-sigma factor
VATVAHDEFSMPFAMHLETRGKATVLQLSGEFDLTVKKAFEASLSGIGSGSPKHVVVDLRRVAFIDSTGVRLILEAWNQCRRMGIEFTVVLGASPARSTFAELGLDRALPIVDDLPDDL